MKVAKVLKICAIIVWVLGFIIGLLPIISMASISDYYYYNYIGWMTYVYAVIIWFAFFVAGMAQFGFAVMLENVDSMRRRTDEQLYYLTGAVQHLEGAILQSAAAKSDTVNQ